jgi:hypothetical protein
MEDGKTPWFFHLPFSIRHWAGLFIGLLRHGSSESEVGGALDAGFPQDAENAS